MAHVVPAPVLALDPWQWISQGLCPQGLEGLMGEDMQQTGKQINIRTKIMVNRWREWLQNDRMGRGCAFRLSSHGGPLLGSKIKLGNERRGNQGKSNWNGTWRDMKWERSVGQCGLEHREWGRVRWEKDKGWSHIQSDSHIFHAFPCHPASPVSLILVTEEFEVWAWPGLGAGRDRA